MLQSAGMPFSHSVLDQESTYALLCPSSPPMVLFDAVMLNLCFCFPVLDPEILTLLFKKEQISNKIC